MTTYYEMFDEARGRIPEHEARELLLWASGFDMAQLLVEFAAPMTEEAEAKFRAALEERASGKPLQYITHRQNFCGLDFYVDEHVLIPRYDTEVLVEKVLDDSEKELDNPGCRRNHHRPRVLDLCTGSGCIAVALARLGGYGVTGSDISREALEIADRNAAANGVEITFYESDMFRQLPKPAVKPAADRHSPENEKDIAADQHSPKNEKDTAAAQHSPKPQKESAQCQHSPESTDDNYDIIVSNPPYVRSSVIETLSRDVRDFEPRLALDGTEDGLRFYRIIAAEAPQYLKPRGRLYLEIGYDQAEEVKALLANAGFMDITVTKDLSGLDRVVSARSAEKNACVGPEKDRN